MAAGAATLPDGGGAASPAGADAASPAGAGEAGVAAAVEGEGIARRSLYPSIYRNTSIRRLLVFDYAATALGFQPDRPGTSVSTATSSLAQAGFAAGARSGGR